MPEWLNALLNSKLKSTHTLFSCNFHETLEIEQFSIRKFCGNTKLKSSFPMDADWLSSLTTHSTTESFISTEANFNLNSRLRVNTVHHSVIVKIQFFFNKEKENFLVLWIFFVVYFGCLVYTKSIKTSRFFSCLQFVSLQHLQYVGKYSQAKRVVLVGNSIGYFLSNSSGVCQWCE